MISEIEESEGYDQDPSIRHPSNLNIGKTVNKSTFIKGGGEGSTSFITQPDALDS